MRLNEKPVDVVRSGDFKEASFGIDAGNQAHIIRILRDKLYANKPLAVIREYATNAYDAHVEAGCADRPIEVTLPSKLDPVFRVRDYGRGLSEDDITRIYIKYGVSTKRDSDDYVGQLGVGNKAMFCYTDSGMIISYHGGTKRTYSAYIDESTVGKLARLAAEPTDAPNGMEIVVPVRMEDIGVFVDNARRALQYFPVKPVVRGVPDFAYPTLREIISGADIDGTPWFVYYESIPTAIMGNIGYPIEPKNMGKLEEWERKLLLCPVHIHFKIGDVDIAASREALEYTPRTIACIRAKLELIRTHIIETLKRRIEGAGDLLAAKQAFAAFYMSRSGFNDFVQHIKNGSFAWHGIPVDSMILDLHGYSHPGGYRHYNTIINRCAEQKGHRYSSPMQFRQTVTWDIRAGEHIVLVDVDTTDKWFSRVTKLWADLHAQTGVKHTIYAIKFDPAERAELTAQYHLDRMPIIKVSSLTNAVPRGKRTSDPKHRTRVFQLDPTALPVTLNARSGYWTTTEADLARGTGLYIELDAFMLKLNDCLTHIHELRRILRCLEACGVPAPPLTGFKTALIPKLGAGWVRFDEWANDLIIKWLEGNGGMLSRQTDLDHVQRNLVYNDTVKVLLDVVHHVKDRTSPFFVYMTNLKRMHEGGEDLEQHEALLTYAKSTKLYKNNFQPSFDLPAARAALYERYPMLHATGLLTTQYGAADINYLMALSASKKDGARHAREIMDYINTMDHYYQLTGGAV